MEIYTDRDGEVIFKNTPRWENGRGGCGGADHYRTAMSAAVSRLSAKKRTKKADEVLLKLCQSAAQFLSKRIAV